MDSVPSILETKASPNDDDLVPLPIERTECENKSTVEPLPIKSEMAQPSPPPLPVADAVDPPKYIATAPVPVVQAPKATVYSPKMHSRSPPKFVAAHLKAPPPLTPMKDIASNGSVISRQTVAATVDANGLPPPPPPPPPAANGFYAPPPPPPPAAMGGVPMAGGYAIEYRCSPCHLLFNTKHELIRHKREVHPPAMSPSKRGRGGAYGMGRAPRFHCNLCQRSFSGKQHFEYHMRTHSGEKPFKCGTCGKAFRAKHSLKNHMRIHTGERPYQCKVCGKWFRQLGVMKNHIKNMHEGPQQMAHRGRGRGRGRGLIRGGPAMHL